MWNTITHLALVIGIPIARSFGGWLIKSLEDNKITKYELRLLAGTTIRVGLMAIMTYIGLSESGIDISAFGATAAGFLLDRLFGSIKDNNNVTRR